MSISSAQATEATIFLTLYKEAIETLKQSAVRDSTNEIIQSFTNKIIPIVDNRYFKKICNPKDPTITYQNSKNYREIVKDVRVFQFSHYLFLKYLPNFISHTGNSRELISYIREQNDKLENELKGKGIDI